jgi:hypothetical protein
MNRQKLGDGFDFDNDGVFDQEIYDVAPGDMHSLVLKRQGDAATARELPKLQLVAQARVIAGFQQPGTQMPMYLDGSPDDLVADRIGGMVYEPHGLSRKNRT